MVRLRLLRGGHSKPLTVMSVLVCGEWGPFQLEKNHSKACSALGQLSRRPAEVQ